MTLDPVALRQAYDAQLRAHVPDQLPDGTLLERDGPLKRLVDPIERGFVSYSDLGGLDGPELDALIARQRDYFAARGQGVEWKLHSHDQPADLADRLRAAGFEPEEQETVVIGLAEPLATGADPAGIRLREVTSREDLDRIEAMETVVWGRPRPTFTETMLRELAADPTGTAIVVVESDDADPTVVCAGWIRFVAGTSFGTLWGGSTLPDWRGRGCYTALVRYRARLALARGLRYLQVDASEDSRPILERAGFVPVTTTTPYVYKP